MSKDREEIIRIIETLRLRHEAELRPWLEKLEYVRNLAAHIADVADGKADLFPDDDSAESEAKG